MQPRSILLTLAATVALAAAFTPAVAARSGADGLRASQMPPQHLAIVIRPTKGIGHNEHVTVPNLAVEPGLPVTITFTNYTRAFHTFTARRLGVSALIYPAHSSTPTKTVVTFTAHKYGAFDWACLLCPDSASWGREVGMNGKIYAIIQV